MRPYIKPDTVANALALIIILLILLADWLSESVANLICGG